MIIGQKSGIKEKEYKSWRIYLIFRALANNRQKPIKAKSKTHKSFCQTTFYHYLSHYVLCHENQGVTNSHLDRHPSNPLSDHVIQIN